MKALKPYIIWKIQCITLIIFTLHYTGTAQNKKKYSQEIKISASFHKYADSTLQSILTNPQYGRMSLNNSFQRLKQKGLQQETVNWFKVLLGSASKTPDKTMITQSTRLLEIEPRTRYSHFPLNPDEALESAITLTEKRFTIEEALVLQEKYNINLINVLVDPVFPTSRVLFSDVIVIAKADSLIPTQNFKTDFFNKYPQKQHLLQITIDTVLKGQITSKTLLLPDQFVAENFDPSGWDGPLPIKPKERYVFYLRKVQNSPLSNLYETETRENKIPSAAEGKFMKDW